MCIYRFMFLWWVMLVGFFPGPHEYSDNCWCHGRDTYIWRGFHMVLFMPSLSRIVCVCVCVCVSVRVCACASQRGRMGERSGKREREMMMMRMMMLVCCC